MEAKKLSGSEFETLISEQAAIYEKTGQACFGRYGVQASMRPMLGQPGKVEPVVMQSLPDFEGVIRGGQHVIFDAKVCSAASFNWAKYRTETRGARSRQLRHMLKRSRFGAQCFFLFHWNERQLKKSTIPAATYLLPVRADWSYWDSVESLEVKSLTIEVCELMGRRVVWRAAAGARKARPDFLEAIRRTINSEEIREPMGDLFRPMSVGE